MVLQQSRDYRRFIKAYLQRHGLLQKEFACRVNRSPAWVSQMLTGKRSLRPAFARQVGLALDMTPREQLQLQALVESEDNRAFLDDEPETAHFAQCEPGLVTDKPLEPRLDSLELCAVYQLAQCEEYCPDPAWIAATIRPRLDESGVRLALEVLKSRGLLGENGRVPVAHGPAEPGCVATPESADAYHRDTLARATKALDTVPENERTFVAGCIALSEDDYERFREQVQALLLHILRTVAKERPNRVYHVNLAAFPMSLYSDSAADPWTIED